MDIIFMAKSRKEVKKESNTQLYIIGEEINSFFCPNICKKFPDKRYISPETEVDVYQFISDMATESIQAKIIPILLINGHGTQGLTHFSFPKLKIQSTIISDFLKHIKSIDSNFRCVVLVNTCFSGGFDNTCAEGIITSTDHLHASRGNLLPSALNEVLSNSDIFNFRDIYTISHYDEKTDYSELSQTIKIRLAWNFGSNENQNVKVSECYSQFYGTSTDLLLKPVISGDIMNQAVEMTAKKYKTQQLSSERINEQLEKILGRTIHINEFFSSMTLRQYNMKKNPIPKT